MRFDSLADLKGAIREAVIGRLYHLADDEFIVGQCSSKAACQTTVPELDETLSSIAGAEVRHARAYYQMLHELGEGDPDTLAFGRNHRDFRCANLVSLPTGDWGFTIVRQFLYDASETVRLSALAESSLTPLAHLAIQLRGEERQHLMHGRNWVLRLGSASEENHRVMQAALHAAYPHALGLFEPTECDEPLAQARISPREDELQRQWESAVAPVLADAGLRVPEEAPPVYGGRVGRHPTTLKELLDRLQSAYNIDRTAKW